MGGAAARQVCRTGTDRTFSQRNKGLGLRHRKTAIVSSSLKEVIKARKASGEYQSPDSISASKVTDAKVRALAFPTDQRGSQITLHSTELRSNVSPDVPQIIDVTRYTIEMSYFVIKM